MTTILQSWDAKGAAALSGFNTVAMLDYLQRSGVFEPKGVKGTRGRGKGRRYTFRDILVLKAIKRLLDSGASVAFLKKSLIEFQSKKWHSDPTVLEDSNGIVRYLIASEMQVLLVSSPDVIVDLSKKGQLTFSFIVDLDNLHSELRESLGLAVVRQEELDLTTAQT